MWQVTDVYITKNFKCHINNLLHKNLIEKENSIFLKNIFLLLFNHIYSSLGIIGHNKKKNPETLEIQDYNLK